MWPELAHGWSESELIEDAAKAALEAVSDVSGTGELAEQFQRLGEGSVLGVAIEVGSPIDHVRQVTHELLGGMLRSEDTERSLLRDGSRYTISLVGLDVAGGGDTREGKGDSQAVIARLMAELGRERAARRHAEAQLAEVLKMALPKVAEVASPEPAAAPVPATIEPLPKELEKTLGRDAIWALVRPAPGEDDRSVIERHEVFWKRFDEVLEARGPEGSKVLRKPLQDYLDGLVGLSFTRDEKQRIVARLNFMMRSMGLRAMSGDAVGPLVVYGSAGTGSLRIQASLSGGSGRRRLYRALGTSFPSLSLVAAESTKPRVALSDRKRGRYKHL